MFCNIPKARGFSSFSISVCGLGCPIFFLLLFFASKRNKAKKTFRFLFASFHETKKYVSLLFGFFCFISLFGINVFASFCFVLFRFFQSKFFLFRLESNVRCFLTVCNEEEICCKYGNTVVQSKLFNPPIQSQLFNPAVSS